MDQDAAPERRYGAIAVLLAMLIAALVAGAGAYWVARSDADTTLPGPTSAEAGFPEYRSESWFGMVAPRALPKHLVTRISADTVNVLKEPAVRDRIVRAGAEPRYSTPEAFAKMQRDEYVELAALIKETGMKSQ